jgi:ketosteroid isomerase-like protein
LPDTGRVSAKDVEIVRELYAGTPVDLAELFANDSAREAWQERLERFVHPDFEGGNPDSQAFMRVGGLDAFIELWREWFSAWESWWFEVEDFVPGVEGNVVALLNIRARSKRDRVDFPIPGANLVTVKDGKIARLYLYFDRNAALKDAGIARRG